MKSVIAALIGLSTLALVCFCVLSFNVPWSPLNCWHYDVDINSGRVRYTRYLLWQRVASRVEESALSRWADDAGAPARPEWRRVQTFSPGVGHSPHYRFHGALSQISLLEKTWELGRCSDDARGASANAILRLWQIGGAAAAEPYLRGLAEIAHDHDLSARPTEDSDLVERDALPGEINQHDR
ncbi:MAG: hypothetical protein KY475_13265 [Planctomycetes bacterium]|nr:hypothetical protein [Planctomycetota bacterium]